MNQGEDPGGLQAQGDVIRQVLGGPPGAVSDGHIIGGKALEFLDGPKKNLQVPIPLGWKQFKGKH
jgi:hypothetical protein